MAPAGITGLWQVKRRGNKDMSVEERISIDIIYASKCSFATDLWIIANTPSALIQKANAGRETVVDGLLVILFLCQKITL